MNECANLNGATRMRGRKLITFEEDPARFTGIPEDINGIR